MANSLISFVILSWNSQQTIIASVDSIISIMATNDITDYEIFVVDNGSNDRTLKLLRKYDDNKHFKVIKLPTNKGTTFSRNQALRLTKGEYICVMDSDVVIKELKWERILTAFHEGIGLVVPQLYLPDGSIQHNVKKFPRFHWRLKKLLNTFFGIHGFDRELYPDLENIRYPDVAISAFWVLRREALNAVGLLDEKIFYSPEDVDYCVRLWKKGFAISYVREGNILHHTQRITHKNPVSFIAFTFFVNFIYYFFKHSYFFSTGRLDQRKSQVLLDLGFVK